MDSYVLGILWSTGGLIEDRYDYFILRHRDRYFLDTVRESLGLQGTIFLGSSRTGPQYKLKVFHFDLGYMESLGWQSRQNEQRNYPSIPEHPGFIRAYLEIHSILDTITVRKYDRPPRTGPRLRIYGNRLFLEQLSQVLVTEIGVGLKKVQKATNFSVPSGILYYQSRAELLRIYHYLYSPNPLCYHPTYRENFNTLLQKGDSKNV